ncbi:hypothetical protein QJS10_CPA06g01174 [Acorus calamus]|uniref:Disease resistance protein At4g27190-like leucine-rich repeats domain-containing protein n=1 Tax=Acorus calamus TaxID=4465 RepID=A0AAV9EPY8_ACOCL|nr:hypothetical protein QJS10_CPA06g01174 [Acorus calamus]
MKIAFPNGESPKFLVKTGVKKQQIPEEKEWEQVERISLMSSDLNLLRVIPKAFFVRMSKLRVVDLSNTEIQFLPKSPFALSNLRGLNLNGCRRLKDFPSLKSYQLVPFVKYGHLENLELLDIRGSHASLQNCNVRLKKLYVIDLPKLQGIWKGIVPQNGLASLMLLDLRRCPSLTMVLTLSAAQQLCLLEELRVKNCSNITEVVGYEETVKEGYSSQS